MAPGESLPPNSVPEIPPAHPTPDPWPPLQELMCVPLIKLLADIHLNPSRLLSGPLLSGCPSLSADPGWVLEQNRSGGCGFIERLQNGETLESEVSVLAGSPANPRRLR